MAEEARDGSGNSGSDGPARCLRCGTSLKFKSHTYNEPEGQGALCDACAIARKKGRQRKMVSDDDTAEHAVNSNFMPEVNMEFENEVKAYDFYNKYAGIIGFSVRKGWLHKSSEKVTTSRTLVCSKEGFRREKRGTKEVKRPRPETRTGCLARMTIKLTSAGTYRIAEFVPHHNHRLAPSSAVHMLRSQRITSEVNDADADSSDDSESTPRSTSQPTVRHAGSFQNVGFFPANFRMSLRSKRKRDMKVGDAEAILKYLQSMQLNDRSFFYAIQVDEDDKLTNIFWADARSVVDFGYFGDVVCLDTSYKVNEYGRPFAPFLGVNHHKQSVIFGAALLYDDTVESFKWLFETFKIAMHGKEPKTILTDDSSAMTTAIGAVWPDTTHRLCGHQAYQNAITNLDHVLRRTKTFSKDFSRCIYDIEDEDEFLSAWQSMLQNYDLRSNQCLANLFNNRKKWSLAYGRHVFCGDIRSTQQSENLGIVLKEYLSPQVDLLTFFKQYETIIDEKRYAELQADFHASQSCPRIPSSRMLRQAANLYTPAVYELFKREFDVFMDCTLYFSGEAGTISEYRIFVGENPKEHLARLDYSDCSVSCSCKKFEFVGIQCGHVLKVLDVRNIKELPECYFSRRWRKDCKLEEKGDRPVDGDSLPRV